MTGFASVSGSGHGHDWVWEIRAVNGKGFDLRLRLPEVEGLEAEVRGSVARLVTRGNVQINLRFAQTSGDDKLRLSKPGLRAALGVLREVEEEARAQGVSLAPARATDLLTLRGVLDQGPAEAAEQAPLRAALLADLARLLEDFVAMRAAEGGQLCGIIVAQIDRIAQLTERAAEVAEARRPEMAAALQAALARVMEGAAGGDPQRVAQELALLAVKADVTEEVDRLRAHLAAARALLAEPGPVGRKFDFLTQEFVREANTLCSKSGSTALTAIGLDLKHVIDQMREQIQNVE
jgi:uncharacterized protein (TIGR00255 family)